MYGKGTNNLEAYVKLVEGLELLLTFDNKETNARARKLFEETIAIDPQYAAAYSNLGWAHQWDAVLGWSESPEKSLGLAEEMARKAIALDDSLFDAHGLLGSVLAVTERYDESLAEGKRAVELAPSASDSHIEYGYILELNGRYQDAIEFSEKAVRINPFPPALYLFQLAFEYLMVGKHEESISVCKRVINLQPDNEFAHQVLAANYSMTGRDEEARAEAKKILRINPTYSQDTFEKGFVPSYKDKASVQRFCDALRKAGLK